jgi:hypothetical protein
VEAHQRPADHFIWQRHPFTRTHAGFPTRVFPQLSFLLPYWLARHHGFLEEDGAGRCLRWAK